MRKASYTNIAQEMERAGIAKKDCYSGPVAWYAKSFYSAKAV